MVEGLTKREPGAASDILLLRWWQQMVEDGELLEVFGDCVATPSGFLSVFNDPRTTLYYIADDDGIGLSLWYEPFMGNTALGMWGRKDWRKRRWWDALKATMVEQLKQYPMVIAMTRNQNLVVAGPDMGFVKLGQVPYLYRGDTCDILYCTRESFTAKHGIEIAVEEQPSGQSSG